MKSNINVINFLRIFFRLAYLLTFFGIAIMAIGMIFNLFKTDNIIFIPFSGAVNLDLSTTYELFSGESINKDIAYNLHLGRVGSSGLFFQLLDFFNIVIRGGVMVFLFRYAYYIFDELKEQRKSGSYFSIKIYRWIRKVGFLMFVYPFCFLINGFIVSQYVVEKIRILGQEVQFQFDYTSLSQIVSVLVIFVFAEIYRTGIEMKEESEYTI